MSDTYSIEVECSNCDKSSKAELPKGTPADEPLECPNCGCKTAKKKRAKINNTRSTPRESITVNPYPALPESESVIWTHQPEFPPREPVRRTFEPELSDAVFGAPEMVCAVTVDGVRESCPNGYR
jgi:DNA-directed RNA polymerase subunit RPC12/RpoP